MTATEQAAHRLLKRMGLSIPEDHAALVKQLEEIATARNVHRADALCAQLCLMNLSKKNAPSRN